MCRAGVPACPSMPWSKELRVCREVQDHSRANGISEETVTAWSLFHSENVSSPNCNWGQKASGQSGPAHL